MRERERESFTEKMRHIHKDVLEGNSDFYGKVTPFPNPTLQTMAKAVMGLQKAVDYF